MNIICGILIVILLVVILLTRHCIRKSQFEIKPIPNANKTVNIGDNVYIDHSLALTLDGELRPNFNYNISDGRCMKINTSTPSNEINLNDWETINDLPKLDSQTLLSCPSTDNLDTRYLHISPNHCTVFIKRTGGLKIKCLEFRGGKIGNPEMIPNRITSYPNTTAVTMTNYKNCNVIKTINTTDEARIYINFDKFNVAYPLQYIKIQSDDFTPLNNVFVGVYETWETGTSYVDFNNAKIIFEYQAPPELDKITLEIYLGKNAPDRTDNIQTIIDANQCIADQTNCVDENGNLLLYQYYIDSNTQRCFVPKIEVSMNTFRGTVFPMFDITDTTFGNDQFMKCADGYGGYKKIGTPEPFVQPPTGRKDYMVTRFIATGVDCMVYDPNTFKVDRWRAIDINNIPIDITSYVFDKTTNSSGVIYLKNNTFPGIYSDGTANSVMRCEMSSLKRHLSDPFGRTLIIAYSTPVGSTENCDLFSIGNEGDAIQVYIYILGGGQSCKIQIIYAGRTHETNYNTGYSVSNGEVRVLSFSLTSVNLIVSVDGNIMSVPHNYNFIEAKEGKISPFIGFNKIYLFGRSNSNNIPYTQNNGKIIIHEMRVYDSTITINNDLLIINNTIPGYVGPKPLESILWLDTSDNTTLFSDISGTVPVSNGDKVKFIKDKSTSKNDASYTLGTYKYVANALNGLGGIMSPDPNDGTQDYKYAAFGYKNPKVLSGLTTFCVCIVFKCEEIFISSTNLPCIPLLTHYDSGTYKSGSHPNVLKWPGYNGIFEVVGSDARIATSTKPYSIFNPTIYIINMRNISGTYYTELYQNGTKFYGAPQKNNISTGYEYAFGAFERPDGIINSIFSICGYFYEIKILNSGLESSQITDLTNELKAKWGIS